MSYIVLPRIEAFRSNRNFDVNARRIQNIITIFKMMISKEMSEFMLT